MKDKCSDKKGISLVEAVIGTAIVSLTLVGSIVVYNYFINAWSKNLANIQSAYLLEEGTEIIYYLRDSGWSSNISSIPVNTTRYFGWNGSNWTSTTTNSYVDGLFQRSFILGSVYRDSNGNIASSGNLDTNSKKATVYVAWRSSGGTTTKSMSIYISNIFNN